MVMGEKSGMHTYVHYMHAVRSEALNGVGVQIPPWAFDRYYRGASHRRAERAGELRDTTLWKAKEDYCFF
jgi:hypothetical protein